MLANVKSFDAEAADNPDFKEKFQTVIGAVGGRHLLHRHRWATPYLLLLPGLLGWPCFSSCRCTTSATRRSSRGDLFSGYVFSWAGTTTPTPGRSTATLHPLVRIRGDRDPHRVPHQLSRSRTGSPSAAGGEKNLLLLLIIAPFFVTYLIRTLALEDDPRRRRHRRLGLPAPAPRFLGRPAPRDDDAVIAGITYNFLPFMALPIYVSLEQIDQRLIEAAETSTQPGQGVLQGSRSRSRSPVSSPERCSRSSPPRATSSTRNSSGRRGS
jgi:hypothetical protein